MTYSTIYYADDAMTAADGVQSQAVCNATKVTARDIAKRTGRAVVVEDQGTRECYVVTPAGDIESVPQSWPPPPWEFADE